MTINQISVFLENRPGQLANICRTLAEADISIVTLSLADTAEFGIVRMIVHSGQIEGAMKMLKDGGYVARVNHVICATVPDKPLGLSSLLGVIERAGAQKLLECHENRLAIVGPRAHLLVVIAKRTHVAALARGKPSDHQDHGAPTLPSTTMHASISSSAICR